MSVEMFDIGNSVVCDCCNKDYTNSTAEGGFIFESKGVCPECSKDFMSNAIKYGEQHFIRDEAVLGETFRDFIIRSRGGNNTVKITTYDNVDDMLADMFANK